MNKPLLHSPPLRFFDFIYIWRNIDSYITNFFIQKNGYQNLHTCKLKLTRRREEGRGISFHSPLRSKFKIFRVSKFLNFFVSKYGLTTANMCTRFKIAYIYTFCRKLYTELTHFQDFALSAISRAYRAPL